MPKKRKIPEVPDVKGTRTPRLLSAFFRDATGGGEGGRRPSVNYEASLW